MLCKWKFRFSAFESKFLIRFIIKVFKNILYFHWRSQYEYCRMQILGISVKILLTGAKQFSEWLPFFVRADRNHFTDHHEAKFGLFRTICVNLWDSWDVIELPISNLTSRVAFQVIKLFQFYPFNCMHRYFELSLRCRSDLRDFEHTEITRTHGNFPLGSW